jgi:uncharacterized membrane protein YsdA (DUF1294 family)
MESPALLPFAHAALYFVPINFVAFAAFGADKLLAEARAWRISEASLLGLAIIGGSPGAYAGRHVFRHKTRKQPFSGELHTIACAQFVLLTGVVTWVLSG